MVGPVGGRGMRCSFTTDSRHCLMRVSNYSKTEGSCSFQGNPEVYDARSFLEKTLSYRGFQVTAVMVRAGAVWAMGAWLLYASALLAHSKGLSKKPPVQAIDRRHLIVKNWWADCVKSLQKHVKVSRELVLQSSSYEKWSVLYFIEMEYRHSVGAYCWVTRCYVSRDHWFVVDQATDSNVHCVRTQPSSLITQKIIRLSLVMPILMSPLQPTVWRFLYTTSLPWAWWCVRWQCSLEVLGLRLRNINNDNCDKNIKFLLMRFNDWWN